MPLNIRNNTEQSGLVGSDNLTEGLLNKTLSGSSNFIVAGNLAGAFITSGAANFGLTFIAVSGATESIMSWRVQDNTTDKFTINNNTGGSGVFAPQILGFVQSLTNTPLTFLGSTQSGDTGSNPMILFDGRLSAAQIATRPILDIQSFGVAGLRTRFTMTSMTQQSGMATNLKDTNIAGPLTLQSGMSGISFSGMQLLPDLGNSCDAVMWISGTYRVATPADGQIIYSGSNPTSGLMAALNTLGYSTAGNARAGGTILIKKGGYNFPETVFMRSGEVNNIGNVQIIGEGRHATRLNWVSSGEDYGIYIQAGRMVFKDLTIEGTSSTNPAFELVHMIGNGQTNLFDNVKFNGQEQGNPALSGMNGVVIEGAGNAAYYATFSKCNFGSLDIGIWLQSGFTNAAHVSDCVFAIANTGILCEGSDQNMIQNCYLQGGISGGISLVELKGGAFFNQISNVQSETFLSGTQTVLVGSGCHLNQVYGAINTNFNNAGTQTAIRDLCSVDTSGNRTNRRNILHDSHIHPTSGVTVGTSPFIFTNDIGTEIQVYVGGGTVSEIRNINTPNTSGVVLSGLTQGSFTLNAGDSLYVAYSVAPGIFYKSV